MRQKDGGRRVKKHKACASEFDYRGWKEWGTWRRGVDVAWALEHSTDSSTDSEGDVEMEDVDFAEKSDDDGDDVLTQSVMSPLFGSLAQQQMQDSALNGRWFRSKSQAPTLAVLEPPKRPSRYDEKNCTRNCDYPSECRWGKAYGVPTPATATFLFADKAVSPLFTYSEAEIEENALTRTEKTTLPATTFDDILAGTQQNIANTIDGVASVEVDNIHLESSFDNSISHGNAAADEEITIFSDLHSSSPSPKTVFTDLTTLVERAQRRKSRSGEGIGQSPLSAVSSSTSSLASELNISDIDEEKAEDEGKRQSMLLAMAKEKDKTAFDGLEDDFRKGLERAGEALFSGLSGLFKGKKAESGRK